MVRGWSGETYRSQVFPGQCLKARARRGWVLRDGHPLPPFPTSQLLLLSVPGGRELQLSPLCLRSATRDPGKMGVGGVLEGAVS